MRDYLCSRRAVALLALISIFVACGGSNSPTESPAPAPTVEAAGIP